jgi:hypothetical protein
MKTPTIITLGLYLSIVSSGCAQRWEHEVEPFPTGVPSGPTLWVWNANGGIQVCTDFIFCRDTDSRRKAYDNLETEGSLYAQYAAEKAIACEKELELERTKIGDATIAYNNEHYIRGRFIAASLPPITDDGRDHFKIGRKLFVDARTEEGIESAIRELEGAVRSAPWSPEAQQNLALADDAAGGFFYYESILHWEIYLNLQYYKRGLERDNANQERALKDYGVASKEVEAKYEAEIRDVRDRISSVKAKLQEEWDTPYSKIRNEIDGTSEIQHH